MNKDKDIPCAVVKDLLPNYIDKLTSEETNRILEKHFTDCADCAKKRDEMMRTIKVDKVPENTDFKKYLNKTKRMYLLKGIVLSIGVLGIIVSFIVDMAVSHKLTWSLIVDAGMLYIYAAVLTAIFSKKNKIIKTITVLSVLVLPMLYIMEYVINMYYMESPVHWFKIYALPITLIWLAIIWIIVFVKKFMKLNNWYVLGILFLLIILGSVFTDVIACRTSISNIYKGNYEWIDALAYLGCAIVCFIIGYRRKDKCKF